MRHYSIKERAGAALLDLPRFLWAMRPSGTPARGSHWVAVRNRREHTETHSSGSGVRCDWQWTSEVHVTNVFPCLGGWLMRRALRDSPIVLADAPAAATAVPDVSFIIGHRGTARLPHLLLTLRSIAAQEDVAFECIVIEQSERPEIRSALPGWVRYVHTPTPVGMGYSRSWAFNAGARMARGHLLVLHDNDMLVPRHYARELAARHAEGFEMINLKRLVFYLSAAHSARIFATGALQLDEAPEAVVQNLEAGGSVASDREAFFDLGGMDEEFVGWGGEDNEFWDRACTRSVWPFAYLPIIHLWHAPQPEKPDRERDTARLYQTRVAIPPRERIRELATRNFGRENAPPGPPTEPTAPAEAEFTR